MTGNITERQFSYLCQLVEQKDLSSLTIQQREYLLDEPKNFWKMTKQQASNAIGILVKLPKVPELPKPQVVVTDDTVTASPVPELTSAEAYVANATNVNSVTNTAQGNEKEVPAGRYFIVDPTDQTEKFFKVNKPKDGRWKGYTFLEVQASDYFYPIKSPAHRDAVLAEIAKDPIAAMNEYGVRLGRCGKCGRTLTNIDSRLRGLGPICAASMRRYYALALSVEDIDALMQGEEDVDDSQD